MDTRLRHTTRAAKLNKRDYFNKSNEKLNYLCYTKTRNCGSDYNVNINGLQLGTNPLGCKQQ